MAVPAQLPVLEWQSRSVLRPACLWGSDQLQNHLAQGAGSGVSVSGTGTKTASGSGVLVGAVSDVHAKTAMDAKKQNMKPRIIALRIANLVFGTN